MLPSAQSFSTSQFKEIDLVFSSLSHDAFVELYAMSNDAFKLTNYVWNKQLIPFNRIRENIFNDLINYQKLHQKNVKNAIGYMKRADNLFCSNNYESAIFFYTQAIKSVPHNINLEHDYHIAKLYAKRAICFYQTNQPTYAEYDYRCVCHFDLTIGKICLEKAIFNIKTKMMSSTSTSQDEYNTLLQTIFNLQMQNISNNSDNVKNVDSGIYFSSNILSLWFNNKAKGKRHPYGAHFPCAKSALVAGVTVLEERPFVSVSTNLDSLCRVCKKEVDFSFWPCERCDEVVFCSIQCYRSSNLHLFECGFASYFRQQMSPLATILFDLYTKAKFKPEYSTKNDLQERPSLSTDADVYFVNKPNKNKLPKRSYQYRHFLLANSNCKKTLINSQANELISQEVILTLRESADNKDELLPFMVKSELISIVLESIKLLYILEYAIKRNSDKSQISEVNLDLNATKQRLLGIIEDYKRLYRLNIGQGFKSDESGNGIIFAQPILGTFFWPDCKPNLEVVYCASTGTLSYRTNRNIEKHEKLTIAYPIDYISRQCPCMSCKSKVVADELKQL